jgi:hypothetical protein
MLSTEASLPELRQDLNREKIRESTTLHFCIRSLERGVLDGHHTVPLPELSTLQASQSSG